MRRRFPLQYQIIGEQLAHAMPGAMLRIDGGFQRCDAAIATAFTARELEYVKTQTYDVKKVALKARQFIPLSFEAPSGAAEVSYDQFDAFGEAEIIDSYAKPSPRVDAEKRNFGQKIFPLRASYGYSIQDLRAIAMTGSRLNTARAMQSRRAIESKFEKIAARGVPALGISGFCNHADVPVFGTALSWDSATNGRSMYRQLMAIAASIPIATNQIHNPNAMAMPTSAFQLAGVTPFGVDNERSVLQAFLDNNPYGIRFIDQWVQLDGAGAGATDRIVCYERSSEVAEIEVSQDYEEFPPEIRGLEFLTECHMRTAGTVIRYPKAMVYADGEFDVTGLDS